MVREGKKVIPSCPECSCRLNVFELHGLTFAHHFIGEDSEKDAKGHKCSGIGSVWPIKEKSRS